MAVIKLTRSKRFSLSLTFDYLYSDTQGEKSAVETESGPIVMFEEKGAFTGLQNMGFLIHFYIKDIYIRA